MFRSFDPYLVSRVQHAGSHYFDPDTLRFFDAYGGASRHFSRPGEPPHGYALVESVRPPWGDRYYRIVVVTFEDDGSVTIKRIADHLCQSTATRTLARLSWAEIRDLPDLT